MIIKIGERIGSKSDGKRKEKTGCHDAFFTRKFTFKKESPQKLNYVNRLTGTDGKVRCSRRNDTKLLTNLTHISNLDNLLQIKKRLA